MTAARRAMTANLLVPGAGLVLRGEMVVGVLVGVFFGVCANFLVIATVLLPDEVEPTPRGWALGLAAGAYLGAQLRLVQVERQQRRGAEAETRDAALRAARRHYYAGELEAAWAALGPVRDQAEDDLLVAYRVAQVLTARQEVEAALAAWARVKRLDRHHFYRDEVRGHLRYLETLSAAGEPRDASDPPAAGAI